MPRRVFITAAEVSGDNHAAELISALRQLAPDIEVEGIGGPSMAAAGAKLRHETVGNAAMGVNALLRVFEMMKILKDTKRYFAASPPDLQICVDSPAMNFHFAKAAQARHIPVLYYIAPQLWAWREGRMKKVRKWVNHVACILPFEQEYFRGHAVNATFVGHPLFDELPAQRPQSPPPGFPGRAPVVGLLAGSRASEAQANFPHMIQAAKRIRERFPGATFLAPTTAATHKVVAQWVAGANWIEFAQDCFDSMVPRCDLCLTVSGTATLHVAAYNVPMIVVYRGNPVLWHAVGRWVIRTRTFSLVNILAGKGEHIVPEFIPWYGSDEPVIHSAIEFLEHPEKLACQREALRQVIAPMDRRGASMNTAKLALSML